MRFFVLFFLVVMSFSASSRIVVVVNKSSSIVSLDQNDVENIFLAKTKYYPNGTRAAPYELSDNTMRYQFYEMLTDKSPNQLNAYWTTLVFTGKGKPPRKLSSVSVLQRRIFEQQNSISFIHENDVTEDMRVVFKFPEHLTFTEQN